MSGLILAGLGKGLADAGTTYGNMMFKAAEAELADQRAMQRAEALERLKASMEEERAQRDAAKAVEIDNRATQIGQQRVTQQLDTESGKLASNAQKIGGDAPAMSQEEMRAHLESLSPQERNTIAQTGLIGRSLSRNEQRLQAVDDSIQAARETGASSTLLKSYQDAKKSVLDEIKEENRDRRAAEAEDGRERRAAAAEERRSREFQALMPIRQQQADAATTRANKPSGSGSGSADKPPTTADIQRQITAAQNGLATELGVPKNDVNSEVASIRRKANAGNPQAKATLERIQPFLDEYNSANQRMLEFKRASPSNRNSSGSGDSSDNRPTRPPLSSFAR